MEKGKNTNFSLKLVVMTSKVEIWNKIATWCSRVLSSYYNRRKGAKVRGYPSPLSSYKPKTGRISELLREVGATDIARNLENNNYTAIQAIQIIYKSRKTPEYVKRVIDEKAEQLNLIVGRKYTKRREAGRQKLQSKVEQLRGLKPYIVVKSKQLSSLLSSSNGSGYGIFLGLKKVGGAAKAKVLIWHAGVLREKELEPQDIVVPKNQRMALNKLLTSIKQSIQFWSKIPKESSEYVFKRGRLKELNEDLKKVLYYSKLNK